MTNTDSYLLSQCQRATLPRMTHGFPCAILPTCYLSWTCNNDADIWRKVTDAMDAVSVTAATFVVSQVASWCDGDCLYITAW